MDKKEFIFPGVILGVVIITAAGLLITHSQRPALTLNGDIASSTASTTEDGTGSTTKPGISSGYYPYGTLTLSINEVAGFKDGLAIRPAAVVEDSRCPQDVLCIQAGTVKVSLKADVNGKDDMEVIELGKSITLGSDTVTFTAAEPVRMKDAPPTQSAYRLTFVVEPTKKEEVSAKCYIGGCSSEVCTDKPGAVSTCIYRDSYACYKGATCERQANGACGWTQTTELKACLQKADRTV